MHIEEKHTTQVPITQPSTNDSDISLFKKLRKPKHPGIVKTIFAILSVFIGFLLLEFPSNPVLFSMSPVFFAVNILLVGCAFCVFFFLGQRTNTSIVVFLLICFGFGVINRFVVIFKGQPILPTDIFALQTAAAVSSSYSFVPTTEMILSLALFLVFSIVLFIFSPKMKITWKSVLVNIGIGIISIVLAVAAVFYVNVSETLSFKVTKWELEKSYNTYGISLSWMELIQEAIPQEPEGYSAQEAEDILRKYGNNENLVDIPASNITDDMKPTVIAVMNESFTDVSILKDLNVSQTHIPIYDEIAKTSIISGFAYQSHTGGGTCDSEFEFLTGNSIRFVGNTVFPYLLYNMDNVFSLPRYFSDLGYKTTAMHPEHENNYRRAVIYDQFRFDEFLDIEDFQNVETLRNFTTDKATYDKILGLLKEDESPQFIFDVTIQNHGGYQTGLIPDEDLEQIELLEGRKDPELDEFMACMRKSEQDLEYLIQELQKLDRPVLLCFFGDHQPSVSSLLIDSIYNGDVPYEVMVNKYATPYMIWGNDAYHNSNYFESITQKALTGYQVEDIHNQPTSLNFLGMTLSSFTGLPLTDYQKMLIDINHTVFAMNINGYVGIDGQWTEDTTQVNDLLHEYEIVQYANLFYDRKNENIWFGNGK